MKRFWLILILPLIVILGACNRDPKEVAKKYLASGDKYLEKGKFKEASIMYRRALQKDMLYAQVHYRLGCVQLQQNLYAEALRSLHRATDIDSDPKRHEPEARLDPVSRIDALSKMGEIDLSVYMTDPITYKTWLADIKDIAGKILKLDPKAYQGLRLSGFIALADKDLTLAIQKFTEANQMKPDDAGLAWSLVKTLFLAKQQEQAETVAKNLIARHKDYGPMYDI